MNKIKVLFLCNRNAARSQMAEAFLRRYGSEQFEAYSAGIEHGEINPSISSERFVIRLKNESRLG